MSRLIPSPESRPELTPEQIREAAKNYSNVLVHETEKALIGEVEKIEGKVPLPIEIMEHGTCRMDAVTGKQDYFWKGILLVSVEVGIEEDGVKGSRIVVHTQPERKVE